MILSRLSRAIREQNWFAVALEFVIVVAGVLLAFQISAWNEARQDREREAAYLVRLYDEAFQAEAGRLGLLENVTRRVEDAEAIIETLFEGRDPATLPDTACTSLARLGIFYLEGYSLPTLDELFATGSLELIRDEELRGALTAYRSFVQSADERFLGINRDMPNLTRLYPELIETAPVREDEFLRLSASGCDYAGMRENAAFRTDLLDVNARAAFFRLNALREERRRFDAVIAALDKATGTGRSPRS